MKLLELSRGAAAAYAGLLLSELGHEVHRVDTGEGAARDDPFLRRGKRVLEVAPDPSAYDALIEDIGGTAMRRLGLGYRSVRRRLPDLVIVSLSPHGQSGPMRDWAATELTVQAAAGLLHCSGYDGEAPRKLPGDTAAMIAGLHGATAALTAVHGIRNGSERGVHIDISAQDTLMHHWTRHVAQYAYSGSKMRREPSDPQGIHRRHTVRARDGWIYMLALRVPWQDVAAFLGLGAFINFREDNRQPWEQMEQPFHEAVAGRSKYEWFADAAAMGWTFAPVEDPFEVTRNAQSIARDSFRMEEIDGRRVPVPGLPYRIEEGPPDA